MFIVLMIIPVSARANEDAGGIKTSTSLELHGSNLPEIKFRFCQSFTFPFLQGSGPLTKGNNLAIVLSADVSPIFLTGIAEVNWTPAAFFVISGGGFAGSGWNIPTAAGIGINKPVGVLIAGDPPRDAEVDGKAFDGLHWRAWGAGTFQFDLGALIPGDWTHVVFQTRHEFRYSGYTRAGSGDAWYYQNDDGENKNGWKYYASIVLGYQMPKAPVFDMVGIMAEVEKPLYKSTGGDLWGESLGYWVFSALANFSIHPRFNAALAIQMRTRRNHGTSNFQDKDYYYQDFELKKEGGKRRVVFYRVAAILKFKVK
jgi:hypothetical protein